MDECTTNNYYKFMSHTKNEINEREVSPMSLGLISIPFYSHSCANDTRAGIPIDHEMK